MNEPEFSEIRKRLERITPERERIARIFKDHIEKAIDELGPGYIVDLQGKFEATPIRITVEISPIKVPIDEWKTQVNSVLSNYDANWNQGQPTQKH